MRRNFFLVLTVLTLVLLASVSVSAKTWYVDADKANDNGNGQTAATAEKTVTAAIADASAGDIIVLKSATTANYTAFTVSKVGLQFKSSNAASKAVIAGTGALVTIGNNVNGVSLTSLKFLAGAGNTTAITQAAGGVARYLKVIDCDFDLTNIAGPHKAFSNSAASMLDKSVFEGCVIDMNDGADQSVAFNFTGAAYNVDALTIQGCTITGDATQKDANSLGDKAIYMDDSGITTGLFVSGNTFTRTSVDLEGENSGVAHAKTELYFYGNYFNSKYGIRFAEMVGTMVANVNFDAICILGNHFTSSTSASHDDYAILFAGVDDTEITQANVHINWNHFQVSTSTTANSWRGHVATTTYMHANTAAASAGYWKSVVDANYNYWGDDAGPVLYSDVTADVKASRSSGSFSVAANAVQAANVNPPKIDNTSGNGIQIFDRDKNGYIDSAVLWFDRPVNPSTLPIDYTGVSVSGYSVDTTKKPSIGMDNDLLATDILAFRPDGHTNEAQYIAPTSISDLTLAVPRAHFSLTLFLNEKTSTDTGALPDVTYTEAQNITSFGGILDLPGGEVQNITTTDGKEVDKAFPILMGAYTKDNNSNGVIDAYDVVFSENVSVSNTHATKAEVDDGFAIGNALTISAVGDTIIGNTVTLNIVELATNGGLVPTLTYNPIDGTFNGAQAGNASQGYIHDLAKNLAGAYTYSQKVYVNPNSTFPIDPLLNAATAIPDSMRFDAVAPLARVVTAQDSSGNGKIDHVEVQFTETMPLTANIVKTGITFTHTSGTLTPAGSFQHGTFSDRIVFGITEGTTYNTEFVPEMAFSAGSLTDLNGAKYATALTVGKGVDGAAPVIVSATTGDKFKASPNETGTTGALVDSSYTIAADGRLDKMTVVFSEQIKAQTIQKGFPMVKAVLKELTLQNASGTSHTVASTGIYSDTVSVVTPRPTLTNGTSSGDESATLVFYFKQVLNGGSGLVNDGDTGDLPDLTYTKADSNIIADLNGTILSNIVAGGLTETDGAAPVIRMSAGTRDDGRSSTTPHNDYDVGNGPDGYIDGVTLKVTEIVKVGLTAQDTIDIRGDFDVTGMTGNDISFANAVITNLDTTKTYDSTLVIKGISNYKLQATSDHPWDSGDLPKLAYSAGGIIVDTLKTSPHALISLSATQMADEAKPVIAVATGQVNGTNLYVTFSEGVTDETGGALLYTDLTYLNTYTTGTNASSVTALATAAAGDSLYTFTVASTFLLVDVQQDSIQVTAAKVRDVTHAYRVPNVAASVKVTMYDASAPAIEAAITQDIDRDGTIDHIKITLSENLDDTSLNGYVAAQKVIVAATALANWAVEGYTVKAINLTNSAAEAKAATTVAGFDIVNVGDNDMKVLYIMVEEKTVGDTDAVPALTVTGVNAAGSGVADFTPNYMATTTAYKTVDKAGPAVMSATLTSDTSMDVILSETIVDTVATTGGPGTQTLVGLDFSILVGTNWVEWNSYIKDISQPTPALVRMEWTSANPIPAGNGAKVGFRVAGAVNDTSAAANGNVQDINWNLSSLNANLATDGGFAEAALYVPPVASTPVVGAPAGLVITDVAGDNGHWFYATFTVSSDHLSLVKSYQFYREIALDAADPNNLTWVQSAVVQAGKVTDGKSTVLVPSVVNGVAKWGIVASTGEALSEMASAAKAADILVAVLVDGSAKTAGMQLSDMATATGGAIDNIAPSAFETFAAANSADAGVMVTWTAPLDHGVVGYYGANGMSNLPIYGVNSYDVYRRIKGDTEWTLAGNAGVGAVSFTDAIDVGSTVYNYYVKAVDDYTTANPAVVVETAIRSAISTSAQIGDFTGEGAVDSNDFIIFATNYNISMTEDAENWVSSYDLDGDLKVDSNDFIIFATNYGTELVASKAIANMPTNDIPFALGANIDESTSMYFVNVNVGESESLNGVVFELSYDTEALEFVETSVSGLAGLEIVRENEEGIIEVANMFVGEKFDGTITLGFKSKGLNRDVDFEIVNAITVDVDGPALTTNVSNYTVKALPTIYSLSNNYPNPFNPTTTIDYSIPVSGNVELAIFNIAGQKIRTLVDKKQDASFYKVVWDGRDESGASVSSGMYIYRIVSGNFSKIEKMTLMK